MENFVFASDKNYNLQLYFSINSLLENIDFKVNIFIIHKDPESFKYFKNKLAERYNEIQIIIYKFDKKDVDFPNIENRHISEATYYRLFIDKFIPSEVKFYTYLDADIICINNPKYYLNELLNEMVENNYHIACRTEFNRTLKTNEMFDRLKMKSSKYFNAGVMIVNNKKWIENQYSDKLTAKLKEINKDINYWDQDVLNSFFDGYYLEFSYNLNYQIDLNCSLEIKEIKEKGIFLHYQSSNKPWTIEGCFNNASSFYQDYALRFNGKYHIIKTVRRYDLILLIKNTFKFKYKSLKNKSQFYKDSLKLILKKDIKI